MYNKKEEKILNDLFNVKSLRKATSKARKKTFWKMVHAHFKLNWQFNKLLFLAEFIDIKVKLSMFFGKWFKSLNMELIGQLYETYDRDKEKLVHMYDRSKKIEDDKTSFVRNENESLLDIDENNVYGWRERIESEEDNPTAAEIWGIKPIEVSCFDSDKPWQKEGTGFNLAELAILMEKSKSNSKSNKNMN